MLKHSIRGQPCSIPFADPHYTLGDRLTLSRLKQPVLYQTSFSFTGWAYRTLESSELAAAFELPEFVEWNDGLAVEALPLQLLRSVMEHVLPQVEVTEGREPPGKRQKLVPPPRDVKSLSESNAVDMHWLPLLSRWLPGVWTDTEIASRAVKSDNACIDFLPWNRRILLVLPWVTPKTIKIMEKLSYHRWCRALCASLRAYLRSTYGPGWACQLTTG